MIKSKKLNPKIKLNSFGVYATPRIKIPHPQTFMCGSSYSLGIMSAQVTWGKP